MLTQLSFIQSRVKQIAAKKETRSRLSVGKTRRAKQMIILYYYEVILLIIYEWKNLIEDNYFSMISLLIGLDWVRLDW